MLSLPAGSAQRQRTLILSSAAVRAIVQTLGAQLRGPLRDSPKAINAWDDAANALEQALLAVPGRWIGQARDADAPANWLQAALVEAQRVGVQFAERFCAATGRLSILHPSAAQSTIPQPVASSSSGTGAFGSAPGSAAELQARVNRCRCVVAASLTAFLSAILATLSQPPQAPMATPASMATPATPPPTSDAGDRAVGRAGDAFACVLSDAVTPHPTHCAQKPAQRVEVKGVVTSRATTVCDLCPPNLIPHGCPPSARTAAAAYRHHHLPVGTDAGASRKKSLPAAFRRKSLAAPP
jgi:hypothetical protein